MLPPSDKLVKLVPATGLRFNGYGYSAFDTLGYSFSDRFSLQLRFKTFSEEGLLFFVSDRRRDFLSIEMVGGGIVFRVRHRGLGQETANLLFKISGGRLHRVQGLMIRMRCMREGILNV